MRQQQEQLVLLKELEEKRRELEWHLKEAQLERQKLQDAAQVHSGIDEVRPFPEPVPEVCIALKLSLMSVVLHFTELTFLCCSMKVTAGDTHTQRLQKYQQCLLEQNRSVHHVFCN